MNPVSIAFGLWIKLFEFVLQSLMAVLLGLMLLIPIYNFYLLRTLYKQFEDAHVHRNVCLKGGEPDEIEAIPSIKRSNNKKQRHRL